MKIQNSNVSLSSSHDLHYERSEKESLKMWNTPEEAPERLRNRDRLELSKDYRYQKQSAELSGIEGSVEDAGLDPKLMSIIRALESLTGKKIDVSFLKKVAPSDSSFDFLQQTEQQTQLQGWGIDYRYEKHEIHQESLQFSAQGTVQTQDGRKIDFSLALSMQNRSELHESISLKAGDALIDPLVLNFGTGTVSLSTLKHSFDLDLDGKSDTFSFAGSGSGFLALDKNSDGSINDGSELFGPSLGNGFKELSAYDSDKNNWIDENDSVFEKLLIWTKDENGEENLYGLKEKGVGALYLGAVSTAFELESAGYTAGALKESSVFLRENGSVGTLQEMDLKA
ncbi:MAG: hypothetical protein PHH41_10470 [Sulfurimonas sp.]|nr:hypothetical protein [Sulfurimonas sp.]MDD3059389.1 hypothetical protein [Sulfurimonas sp.]MDD5203547.1 hypothetical protein [Sulfurimonas sp.]